MRSAGHRIGLRGRPSFRRPAPPRSADAAAVDLGGLRWVPLFVAPAVALMTVFFLYPFGVIVFHSFTAWDGIAPARFIGLDNFRELWHDPVIRTSLRNNILFALFVPVQVLLSLVVAALIFEHTPGWRVFRALFFLPVCMSPVVVGLMWSAIYDLGGPINAALNAIGLHRFDHDWLATPGTAIPAIMMVVLWATFGFNMTIFLAGMAAMPPILLDAAKVDGSGWWATLFHVVMPQLRRVIELVFVLNLITAFAFMLPYIFVLTGGGPGYSTSVVEYIIYNQGFAFGRLGYASAVSLSLFLLVSVLMFAYVRILARRA